MTLAGAMTRHTYGSGETQPGPITRERNGTVKFKKDDEGKLVLDDAGDPIAIDGEGNVIPLDKVVSLGKHQRVEGERDDYKAQAGKLQKQIEDLSAKGGDAEALQKQIDELKASAATEKDELEKKLSDKDTEFARATKDHAIDTALLGAGVPAERIKAARALLDVDKVELSNGMLTGLDVESFKKDNAYLFETAGSAASAAASRSGPSPEESERLSEARQAAGLPPKKE